MAGFGKVAWFRKSADPPPQRGGVPPGVPPGGTGCYPESLRGYIAWPACTKSQSRVLHRVLQSATQGATFPERRSSGDWRLLAISRQHAGVLHEKTEGTEGKF